VPGGRPSKLIPEIKTKLLKALAAGNHYEPACAYAGISYQTFRNWMKRGETASRGEYLEFFETVQGAIAQGEIASVAKIKKAEDSDWRAAAWMLERRHPDRWASTQRVKLEVEKEMEKTLDHLERQLPPDIFDQVLAALADADGSEEEEGAAAE
jgi:transposase